MIGVKAFDELLSSVPEKLRKFEMNVPKGMSEMGVRRLVTSLAKKNNPTSESDSYLGAGAYEHYIPVGCRPPCGTVGVLHGLYAISARGEPGKSSGDVRVSDRHVRADGHGSLERVAVRRRIGRRRSSDSGSSRRAQPKQDRHVGHASTQSIAQFSRRT